MKHDLPLRLALLALAAAALLAACKSTPLPPEPLAAASMAGASVPVANIATPVVIHAQASNAATARAYRRDAASYLYSLHSDRIYQGRLPPMLYAIGVLQVDVDGRGRVQKIDWMRAPKHAPEVIRDIEEMVRAAQPFPVPVRMGKVTYTDTWLWDQSGRFQLDSLTEGQD